jgi:transposase InsO family protein
VWTWDFVSDITTKGGGFRTLVLIDEHTKQYVAHYVARRIGADDVMAVLSKAIEAYGAPEHIRSENGPEFIARTVRDGLANRGIRTLYIDPGSPSQNGYVESFNSRFRDNASTASSSIRSPKLASSSPTGSASTTRSGPTAE